MQRLTVILAILLLAAATRVVNAGHWPVWTDEGWSTWAAGDHHVGSILDKVAQDRHPPLYFLSLSAWWTVAGDSRIALRFLAIAGGLLTVAVVYRIGADSFGRRAGAYAALLVAVLDITVYYSQEIRHYSWLVLSVCLMTLFFLRYLRQPRPESAVAYTLSIVFMLYTLYFGALFLVVHGIIGLLVWRGTRRQKGALLAAWLGSAILYIPWLVVLSRQIESLSGGVVSLPTSLDGLLASANLLFGGSLAIVLAAFYALGLWRIVRRFKYTITLVAQATIAGSGIGLFAIMFVANSRVGMLTARTLVYLVPMLMLICGYGMDLVKGRWGNVVAAVLVLVALSNRSIIQPRLDSPSVARAVAAQYAPGDLIIIESGWDDNAFRYELTLALGDTSWPEIIPALPWYDYLVRMGPVVPQIEGALKTHSRVWVVNWLIPSQVIPFLDKDGAEYQRVLSQEVPVGAQYESRYPMPAVQVVLYRRVA